MSGQLITFINIPLDESTPLSHETIETIPVQLFMELSEREHYNGMQDLKSVSALNLPLNKQTKQNAIFPLNSVM